MTLTWFYIAIIGAQMVLNLFLGAILLRFYRSFNRQYLQHWALGWWAYVVFHAVTLSAIGAASLPASDIARHAISVIAFTSGYLHIIFVLLGTYELVTARRVSWRWLGWAVALLPVIGLIIAVATASVSVEARLLVRVGIRALLAGLAFFVGAVALFRVSRRTPFGMKIAGIAFALFGLSNVSYFVSYLGRAVSPPWDLVVTNASFIVGVAVVDLLLQTMMGLGMVVWLLEEEQGKLLDAEGRLRHAQQLASLGRMAGGIAHDFNNLLTVSLGYGDELARRLRGTDLESSALEVKKAAERASALTSKLLAFSRKQPREVRLVDLNQLVGGLETMLSRLIGEDVRLATTLAPRPATVEADPTQIEQVIVNLVLNARDAMPEGGTITIRTARATREAREGDATDLPAGDYVRLSVADEGMGMSEDVVGQMFDPFFTTKRGGTGTGLGLSTVYGIVRQSQGFVFVSSSPGRGSELDIYLPFCPDAMSDEAGDEVSELAAQDATILVVEDEEALRGIVEEVLDKRGFRVFAAEGGPAALELEATLPELDVLLTDVRMPGMSGTRLAEAICERRPHVKVLFMSGWTDEDLSSLALKAPSAFLKKPFTPRDLVAHVQRLLTAGQERERELSVARETSPPSPPPPATRP